MLLQDLVVLGIPVSSLGLTLGVLVLSLDVTLQVLGSTFDRVIVVDGLVNDNSANSGCDSKQYLAKYIQSSVSLENREKPEQSLDVQCSASTNTPRDDKHLTNCFKSGCAAGKGRPMTARSKDAKTSTSS